MLIQLSDLDGSVFSHLFTCSFSSAVAHCKKHHAKFVKIRVIGEDFILLLSQQDNIFAAL